MTTNYRQFALRLLNKKELIAAGCFFIFLSLVFVDIGIDIAAGIPFRHLLKEIALEAMIVLTASVSMLIIFWKYFDEKSRHMLSASELHNIKTQRVEAAELSKDFLRKKVELEFQNWELSKSEREVALLLLKGFEIQQIAEQRFTSEKTVRNQAQTIYEKSGKSGRAELSAHFLKELIF